MLLVPPIKISETEHGGDIIRSPNVWFAKILTDDSIKVGATIFVIMRGFFVRKCLIRAIPAVIHTAVALIV